MIVLVTNLFTTWSKFFSNQKFDLVNLPDENVARHFYGSFWFWSFSVLSQKVFSMENFQPPLLLARLLEYYLEAFVSGTTAKPWESDQWEMSHCDLKPNPRIQLHILWPQVHCRNPDLETIAGFPCAWTCITWRKKLNYLLTVRH